MGIFDMFDDDKKLPPMGPELPPVVTTSPADEYAKVGKEQDDKVNAVREGANKTNMVTNLLQAFSGLAGADSLSRGNKAPDSKLFDTVRGQTADSVNQADAGRKQFLQDYLLGKKLDQDKVVQDRATSDFDRKQVTNTREDTAYNADQERIKRESDPNSQESQLARTMANKMLPKINMDGMSAAQINSKLPNFEKMYRIEQDRLSRQDALNQNNQQFKERQQLRTDTLKEQQAKNAQQKTLGHREGVVAVDKDFAKDYNEWTSNGAADAVKNLDQLKNARAAIQKNVESTGLGISGRYDGIMPNFLRGAESKVVQQEVQGAVQATLKQILGGQFTEKEAMNVMARAYDPGLPPADNLKKVDAIIKELEAGIRNKHAKSAYFNKHGTLEGYQLTAPTTVGNSPDQEALDWAKANSNDPRAQEILKLHK